MSYSWLTYSQARNDLALRLSDPNKIFWLDAELKLYLKESLRTFNSISNFFRAKSTFSTQSGFAFYDLTKTSNPDLITAGTGNLSTNPPNLAGYSLIDRDLIIDIEYALIESITTNFSLSTPALTEMFTMADIVGAIQDRRNNFLLETGIHISHNQFAYVAPTIPIVPVDGRVLLSETTDAIIDIRRVAWSNSRTQLYSALFREDEYNATSYASDWETPQDVDPSEYSIFLSPKIGIQVIPVSSESGFLDILSVNSPTNLDQTTGVLLNIPDDLAWIIKFGALADLLTKEGQAYNPTRAAYCQQRWLQGIEIAKSYQLINQITIDGKIVRVSSISDADYYNSDWQNLSGTPTNALICGRNLLALTPVPTSTITIELNLVRNIEIPTLDADFVQIPREYYSDLLDYATHLAMFKCSGGEFQGTFQLLNSFMKSAMENNDRLRAEAKNYDIMKSLSSKEEVDKVRKEEAA